MIEQIKNFFNFHTKLGRTFSWFFVSSFMLVTFALLFVIDSFFGAIYYMQFQDTLRTAALNNRVEYLLKKEEFEYALGNKVDSLKYTSYIHQMLLEDDFKAANRALNVRKLPKLVIIDELKKKTKRLRELDREIKKQVQIRQSQAAVEDDDIQFVFSPKKGLDELRQELELLKSDALDLSEDLLVKVSTVTPRTSQKIVYRNARRFLKSCCGVEMKPFPS